VSRPAKAAVCIRPQWIYTLDSQPIQSTCDMAMMNRNWTRRDRCAWESDADVTAPAEDGSGNSTYFSDRSCASATLRPPLGAGMRRTKKKALALKVYTNAAIVDRRPKLSSETRIVTMMLGSARGRCSLAPYSPDEFVAPISDQLHAARSPAADVEQIASELDPQKLDEDNRHGFRE